MEIYLDNASSTKPDPAVIKVMQPLHEKYFANPSTIHKKGKEAKALLTEARKKFAKLVKSKPEEIIFTSGATEANVLALKGIAEYLFHKTRGKKNRIITTKIGHASIKETCNSLKKKGFIIEYLNIDETGMVDPKELLNLITIRTALISVQWVNNETGVIQDIKGIAEVCKKKEAVFHVDAVQGFTKLPLDLKEVPATFVSFSSHKIHGPKGVGALFVRGGTELFPLFPGSQEFGMRAGTENLPCIIGFVKAAELASKINYKALTKLKEGFSKKILKTISESSIIGGCENTAPHIVNVFFERVDSEALLQQLNKQGIFVSTGSACQQQEITQSHVLEALNISKDGGNVRFSLSKDTTKKELDIVVKALRSIIPQLRKVWVPKVEEVEVLPGRYYSYDGGQNVRSNGK